MLYFIIFYVHNYRFVNYFHFILFFYFRALSGSGRSMATIHILDCPGFQNPATCGRIMGAGLEDLCHNYCQERLQLLFHDSTFLTQQERYLQVNLYIYNHGIFNQLELNLQTF